MLEQIVQWDYRVFEWIHFEWSNSSLDSVMPLLRDKLTWAPIYLCIIGYSFWKFKLKSAVLFISAVILTVALTDLINSRIIKKAVDRSRPCQHIDFKDKINLLVPCGVGRSFPSSHAANHFALSFFLILSLSFGKRLMSVALILWALLISIAQVYVGLHYPLDIFGGALLGGFIAFIVWLGYEKVIFKVKSGV